VRSEDRWHEEFEMIFQPSVFARTALIAALTASLILGVLAMRRPAVHLPGNMIAQTQ
jgi:hypothetical protein